MPKKFDYNKAEADLYDAGARHPEDVFEFKTEKGFRGYMKEHGLNPDKYEKSDSHSHRSNSIFGEPDKSEGCYLTTACVQARGLEDQCDELETLRHFRDGYLASLPGGREEIDHYYAIASNIVEKINRLPDAAKIWNTVYDELVSPA